MKSTKKALSVLLCTLVLLLSLNACLFCFAAEETGGCGSGLTWTYNDASRTLTISGNGSMNNYTSSNYSTPWYAYRSDILKINIEEGVRKIGDCAFYSCSALTKIVLPNSLEIIGNYAFRSCGSLVSVECGAGLKTIGNNAFDLCNSLVTINIPDSVESIGSSAFNNCSALSKMVIGNGVVGIGNFAFNGCRNLTDVTLGANLQTIGMSAFYGCKLVNVKMHNKVAVVGPSAFGSQNTGTISHVYYYGTEAERGEISFGTGNEPLLNAQWHYETIHTHVYTAAVTTPATCSAKGVKTFTCTCGDSYTEAIPLDSTNHVHTENRSGLAATCTETGYTAGVYCADCGNWVSGHALISVDGTNHAALDANGNCTRCGKHIKDVEPTTAPNSEPSGKEQNIFERIIQMILDFFARLFGR